MQIVYHCYGGAHSSVIAAAIHLGILDSQGIPTLDQVISLERFDRTEPEDIGVPYYMGVDIAGNQIFVLGTGKARDICLKTVLSLVSISGQAENQLIFVPTLSSIGLITRIGGFLSRRLGIPRLGRPLVVKGILRDYRKLSEVAVNCRNRYTISPRL